MIQVGWPGDHRYRFFQKIRSDTQDTYPSHCRLTLSNEQLVDGVHVFGEVNCTMLWAEEGSTDFDGTKTLNNFVDLVARFDCG